METLYKIELSNGFLVVLSSFGASILKIMVPDIEGIAEDCVLGFDTKDEYDRDGYSNPYFGGTIGRVANRIKNSKFSIDGVLTKLDPNEYPNHLNGGLLGFSHKNWSSEQIENGVEFSLISKDGDQKYPGRIKVTVKYMITLNELGESKLKIQMDASLTENEKKSTPINLCNHSYFNLAGHGSKYGILDHTLQIFADSFTPPNKPR